MNTRTLLFGLIAGVVAFLLGWLIYGLALGGYFEARTAPNAMEIMRDPPRLAYLLVGNLVYGVVLTWALARMGVSSAMAGITAGIILMGLISLAYHLITYGLMDMYTGRSAIVVDVVASAVIGGIAGAVAGGLLGTRKKADA